jgi:hypothetical protein
MVSAQVNPKYSSVGLGSGCMTHPPRYKSPVTHIWVLILKNHSRDSPTVLFYKK